MLTWRSIQPAQAAAINEAQNNNCLLAVGRAPFHSSSLDTTHVDEASLQTSLLPPLQSLLLLLKQKHPPPFIVKPDGSQNCKTSFKSNHVHVRPSLTVIST